MPYFLGIDIGTSALKTGLFNPSTGECISATSPQKGELDLIVSAPGWAEQRPEDWWHNAVTAIKSFPPEALKQVEGIGITYQMHGLVLLDAGLQPLRPAIIWCDSRATSYGERAFAALGEDYCFNHLLNSPGNFTAAKLAWVREEEPETYKRTRWAMLPGDFIAMRLTGKPATTQPGLSEMILWDFKKQGLAEPVLQTLGLDSALIPEVVPTFAEQGRLTKETAAAVGLKEGTPVSYRAGDQPNNAFSLGCLNPGEVASTAGTSGVVYGISDAPVLDPTQRFNTFLHVNNRFGLLLCINGCGSSYSWLHHQIFGGMPYPEMNALAAQASAGSEGLLFFPFGNGSERILSNRNPGAGFSGLDFQRHDRRHISRAVQEGIAFALKYGMEAGIEATTIRAGDANLFLSDVFAQTMADLTGARVEIWNTDNAIGAARGAAVGTGYFATPPEAFSDMRVVRQFEPSPSPQLLQAYVRWKSLI